jgi:hypothetical protein
MADRRQGPRVLIRRAVQYCWDGGSAAGWGRNIGRGGMYIQNDEYPRPGARVELIVHFRRAPKLSASARVCRVNDTGFAVEFDSLDNVASEAISKVVEATLQGP